MKIYAKSELNYVNGYLVDNDNNVVCVNKSLVENLNQIEEAIQKTAYMNAQPAPVPMPSIAGFKMQHERELKTVIAKPATPITDEKVKTGLAIIAEAKACDDYDEKVSFLNHFRAVIEWIEDEKIISNDNDTPVQFDLKTIGNPLELTVEKLLELAFPEDQED